MQPRIITFDNRTLSVTEWSKRTGLSPQLIYNRLKRGWPIADALNPIKQSPGSKPQSDRASARVRNEFAKLVRDVDQSLRDFRDRLDWLLNEDEYRGVDQNFSKTPNDRATRTAQDSA